MLQISNHIFCDEFILSLDLENRIITNPYADYPYLIIKGFLSQSLLDEITLFVNESQDAEDAAIKKTKKRSIVVPKIDKSIRKTLIYKLGEELQQHYDQAFLRHQSIIEEFFSLALTTSTSVQVLQYLKGYFYIKHADDSSELIDAENQTVGYKQVAPMRKLTSVLFSTSYDETHEDRFHFTGGELKFNYLFDRDGNPIIFRPQAGDMIVFPSNPIFSHEVLPVTFGNRISLVQWHNALLP